MAYAETLERLRKIKEGCPDVPTKPTEPGFVSSVGALRAASSDFQGAPAGGNGPAEATEKTSACPTERTVKTDKTARTDYEYRVRDWLREIGETDPETIEQVIANALADPHGLSNHVPPPEGAP